MNVILARELDTKSRKGHEKSMSSSTPPPLVLREEGDADPELHHSHPLKETSHDATPTKAIKKRKSFNRSNSKDHGNVSSPARSVSTPPAATDSFSKSSGSSPAQKQRGSNVESIDFGSSDEEGNMFRDGQRVVLASATLDAMLAWLTGATAGSSSSVLSF